MNVVFFSGEWGKIKRNKLVLSLATALQWRWVQTYLFVDFKGYIYIPPFASVCRSQNGGCGWPWWVERIELHSIFVEAVPCSLLIYFWMIICLFKIAMLRWLFNLEVNGFFPSLVCLFSRIMKKVVGNRSGCPTIGDRIVELIYIDIVGLAQFKKTLGPSWVHYQ